MRRTSSGLTLAQTMAAREAAAATSDGSAAASTGGGNGNGNGGSGSGSGNLSDGDAGPAARTSPRSPRSPRSSARSSSNLSSSTATTTAELAAAAAAASSLSSVGRCQFEVTKIKRNAETELRITILDARSVVALASKANLLPTATASGRDGGSAAGVAANGDIAEAVADEDGAAGGGSGKAGAEEGSDAAAASSASPGAGAGSGGSGSGSSGGGVYVEVYLLNRTETGSKKVSRRRTSTCACASVMTFNETFTMTSYDPKQEDNTVLVVALMRKRAIRSDACLGVSVTTCRYFPRGTTCSFYDLSRSVGEAASLVGRGFLQLKYKYKEEWILPLRDYLPLERLLLDPDDHTIVWSLGGAAADRDDVARTLLRLYEAHGLANAKVRQLCRVDIAETEKTVSLFRGSSVATKTMDMYMKLFGARYLQAVLRPIVERVMASGSYEVAPAKLDVDEGDAEDATLKTHWGRLIDAFESTCESVFASVALCPPRMRALFRDLQADVEQHFLGADSDEPPPAASPAATRSTESLASSKQDLENLRYTSISGFLFLRFFVPAMLSPRLFKLSQVHPTNEQQRALTLVSKALLTLANCKRDVNESWFKRIEPSIQAQHERFKSFIDELTTLTPEEEDVARTPFATALQTATTGGAAGGGGGANEAAPVRRGSAEVLVTVQPASDGQATDAAADAVGGGDAAGASASADAGADAATDGDAGGEALVRSGSTSSGPMAPLQQRIVVDVEKEMSSIQLHLDQAREKMVSTAEADLAKARKMLAGGDADSEHGVNDAMVAARKARVTQCEESLQTLAGLFGVLDTLDAKLADHARILAAAEVDEQSRREKRRSSTLGRLTRGVRSRLRSIYTFDDRPRRRSSAAGTTPPTAGAGAGPVPRTESSGSTSSGNRLRED